jgi:hypothetical protein
VPGKGDRGKIRARYRAVGYAAPATYFAIRPHVVHVNVTCARGAGGKFRGSRLMLPEQDGQLSGDPVRSLEISVSAWAGLYVSGRGLRIQASCGGAWSFQRRR